MKRAAVVVARGGQLHILEIKANHDRQLRCMLARPMALLGGFGMPAMYIRHRPKTIALAVAEAAANQQYLRARLSI